MNHRKSGLPFSHLFTVAAAVAAGGCAGEMATDPPPVAMAAFELREASFADAVPTRYQSRIHRAGQRPGTISAGMRGASSGSATAEIDATDDRVFFPMPHVPRSFSNQSELARFFIANFGAEEELYDPDTGALIGARGSYAQHGLSYFRDEQGTIFLVTDPVLAYTAGITGVVEVAGERWCLDPDGDCSGEHASYLEPEPTGGEPEFGVEALPTHVNLCGGDCVQFHSFYNTAPFPPWARHGSNVKFLIGGPSSSTQLTASGSIHVPEGLFWDVWPVPGASNTGQNSVEAAVWCFGSFDCVEHRAQAVCGQGSVQDAQVNGMRRTGNGPANATRCF